MAEIQSILDSVKKNLGIGSTYAVFDPDILTHINTTFAVLNQLGVGPKMGFMIEDSDAKWVDYIETDDNLNMLKTYIYLKVRLAFDPPQTSFAIASLEKQASELEWRLNIYADKTWVAPTVPVDDDPDPILIS